MKYICNTSIYRIVRVMSIIFFPVQGIVVLTYVVNTRSPLSMMSIESREVS